MDGNRTLLQSIASSDYNWEQFAIWYGDYDRLVDQQDREKLDYELPDGIVRLVLAQSDKVYFLAKDGWLRSYRISSEDEKLSALEAFQRYGGDVIEDVLEKGSFFVG
jgi:hypothetical protein